MHKVFLLLLTSGCILISCRHEASIELASRPSSGDTTMLFKKVDISSTPGVPGSATSTSTYEYNAERKLIKQVYISTNGSKSFSAESRYVRDNKGRIVSIEAQSHELVNGLPYETPE